MNVSFTDKQKDYIKSLVDSGDYQNGSEALREAIRIYQKYRDSVIADLKVEIEKGWSGSTSNRSVKDIILDKTSK